MDIAEKSNIIDQVQHLPVLEQGGIGLGLCLLAVALYMVSEKLSNAFLWWISAVIGFGGLCVLYTAVFG
jgi:hypothetical protein